MKIEIRRDKVRRIRQAQAHRKRPRPIVVNEDGVFLGNLETARSKCASWGLYQRGYSTMYKDRRMVPTRERDDALLTSVPTVPINWSMNDKHQYAFSRKLQQITGGGA